MELINFKVIVPNSAYAWHAALCCSNASCISNYDRNTNFEEEKIINSELLTKSPNENSVFQAVLPPICIAYKKKYESYF